LQRRLTALVDNARLSRRGSRRWTRYFIPAEAGSTSVHADAEDSLSSESRAALRQLERPLAKRPIAIYRSDYLREYVPGETAWLTETEQTHLRRIGTVIDRFQPAGTYARRIADR